MARFQSTMTFCFVIACTLILAAEVYAVGTHTNRQSAGNGASYGVGTRHNNAWTNYNAFYLYPTNTWPYGQKCEVWMEVCCDTCPGECPTDCCVEFTISYNVKDANGVAGPTITMPADNSCSPCEQCKIVAISHYAGAPGPAPGGYPTNASNTGTWRHPPTSMATTVVAKCKCCPGGGGSAAVNLDEDAVPVPPPPGE